MFLDTRFHNLIGRPHLRLKSETRVIQPRVIIDLGSVIEKPLRKDLMREIRE